MKTSKNNLIAISAEQLHCIMEYSVRAERRSDNSLCLQKEKNTKVISAKNEKALSMVSQLCKDFNVDGTELSVILNNYTHCFVLPS